MKKLKTGRWQLNAYKGCVLQMQTLCRIPEDASAAVEELGREIERFKSGASTTEQFKSFRGSFGICEQRQAGSYMLRARLPAGALSPSQMRALAIVSRKYGNGALHVTTRQNMQIHDMKLDGLYPAVVELLRAELITRGSGGNTVRNIAMCPCASVCAKEVFDVNPHVVIMTEFLLSDSRSYQLPSKLKIAFSGCAKDCAGARVNDIGFIAKTKDGQSGFAVFVGGAMGARSYVANVIEEFVAASEVHLTAEAIKRIFDKHGDRNNHNKARLRFLIERIGLAAFQNLYIAELSKLKVEYHSASILTVLSARQKKLREQMPASQNDSVAAAAVRAESFERWRRVNVAPQRQEGFFIAHIPLPLGVIQADALEKLADIIEIYGDGVIHATQTQNLMMRWLKESELQNIYARLSAFGLTWSPAAIIREMTTCVGAPTCRLSICSSRELAQEITNALTRSDLNLDSFDDLSIRISGCHNACGRHPLASLCFFGVARSCSGKPVPHYVAQLGGVSNESGTRLATGQSAIPACNAPAFVVEFLRAFKTSRHPPNLSAFMDIVVGKDEG